jgi:putative peptide zinc metalloprotease protein
MTSRLRHLALAFVLALSVLAAIAPAGAAAQDNTAVAINTKDESSLFKLAFSIKQVAGEEVDQGSAAVAYASCAKCQTVAIAIQVLLVTAESPAIVTPTNIALAINENCDTCVTMALAYQFVLGVHDLRLTSEGRRELARIRHELHELGKQEELSPEEIKYRTKELMEQLAGVLKTQLVPRGPDEDGQQQEQPDGEPLPEDDEPPPEDPTDTGEQPRSTTPEDEQPQPTAPEPEPEPEPAPEPQPQPQPDQEGTTTSP